MHDDGDEVPETIYVAETGKKKVRWGDDISLPLWHKGWREDSPGVRVLVEYHGLGLGWFTRDELWAYREAYGPRSSP